MLILSKGEKKPIKYVDIIVHTFKQFPKSFHLPGYPQYPDSENIRRQIDSFTTKGYIRTGNRTYIFTDLGMEVAEGLRQQYGKGKETVKELIMAPNDLREYSRLIGLKGFQLFLKDSSTHPLDVDIYDFFNITVRTNKNEVKGRFSIVGELLKKAKSLSLEFSEEMINYKKILEKVYKDIFSNENKT